jgi:hypothetical protein
MPDEAPVTRAILLFMFMTLLRQLRGRKRQGRGGFLFFA